MPVFFAASVSALPDRISTTAIPDLSGFGVNVPVDYRVAAKASWVDARQPSVPGIMPRVEIDGEFVRVRTAEACDQ
ncbi:hypothetical protein [Rhizobium sp. BK418]|uniref:hypothetical protein n=1 Tax=Rhizobium sp. BK418 TaxID=2512120 RepID=UPI0010D1E5B0|nr:hypothetical protein [Rhizobium sp. BK418]TCS00719.1 hypothetical protein EV281_107153 [Rhizobium sp. BK418]